MDTAFHLQHHLDELYNNSARGSGWHGGSDDDFLSWQLTARRKLAELLCIEQSAPVSQRRAECLDEVQRDGYTQAQWCIPARGDVDINAYVLTPDTPGPYQPILVFHGHSPSVQYCLGNYPDAPTEARMLAKQGNYAQAFAQAGYLVVAVEQRGFGLRQSDGHNQRPEVPNTDRHLALFYQLHGKTLLGERVDDGRAVINWMTQQPDINLDGLAVTGNSGGGVTSMYLAAIDERLKIVIPSCCMSSMRDSLLSEHFAHCLCNYVPGLLSSFESGDILACIAPRPLRVIHGEKDHIFPVEGMRQQIEIAMSAYAALDQENACDLYVHSEGHRFDHHGAMLWLAQWR